jgi:hypothetical protein
MAQRILLSPEDALGRLDELYHQLRLEISSGLDVSIETNNYMQEGSPTKPEKSIHIIQIDYVKSH